MREFIRITLTDGGKPLSVKPPRNRGSLVVYGESSAWGRDAAIRLEPRGQVLTDLVALKCRQHGTIGLPVTTRLHNGQLVIESEHDDALPPGKYRMKVRLSDFKGIRAKTVTIGKHGGPVAVSLPVERADEAIKVKSQASWDADVARVLAASTLDKTDGASWLRDKLPRSNRRACVSNILAVCRELGLIPAIHSVYFAEVDRIYVEIEQQHRKKVAERILDPTGFKYEGTPGASIHRSLLDGLPKSQRDKAELHSFRQKRRSPSLQTVVATRGSEVLRAELDIDIGYVYDPVGFLIHFVEVVNPKRTDHVKLTGRIRKRTGAGKFLAHAT